MKKRLLAAAVTAALVVGGFWVCGLDFTQRGVGQGFCYALTIGLSMLVASCPFFDDDEQDRHRGGHGDRGWL
jgi:hypothetical protein